MDKSKRFELRQFVLKRINAYLNIGCSPDQSTVESRPIKLVNVSVLLGSLMFAGYGSFYMSNNLVQYLPIGLLNFGFIPLFFISLYLNHKHRYLSASILLSLLFTLALFLPLTLYLGPTSNAHFYFFMLTILPVVSIKPSRIGLITFLTGLNVFAYYYIDNSRPLFQNRTFYLTYEVIGYLNHFSVLSGIFVILVMVWINQRILYANELELGRKTRSLKIALDNLREMATIDHLTGIYNRNYFEMKVLAEMARAKRYKAHLSMILIDLDYFKKINDNYGHDVGDVVLKESAYRIQSDIRETDFIARWGGEEFVILTPHTDLEGAVQLAEKLRKILESRKIEPAGTVTGSFGVAEFSHLETYEHWYKRVDGALYEAKKGGRNRVVSIAVPSDNGDLPMKKD